MVLTLRVQPANIFHCLLDFLTPQAVEFFSMGLELSVVLKNVFLFFGLLSSIENDNSSCSVPDSQQVPSVVEFHHTDQIFVENLLALALVTKHLAKFVIGSLAHSS
jgi:hypothetical protein